MRGTDTGATVLDGAVRDGELGEVVADHLGLDLNRVEHLSCHHNSVLGSYKVKNNLYLSVVNTNDGTNHLGDNNHVSEVGLDNCRLLIWRCLLLRLAKLLDQTHGLALETALEPPAGTGMDDLQGEGGEYEGDCSSDALS